MTRASVTPIRAIPVLIALIFNIVLVAPPAPVASPAAALTGSSFDATDGNLVVEGGETDWCTPALGVVPKHDLLTGQTDDSYAEGAKENDLNPAVEFGSIPNNKVDLQRTYIASQTGGDGDLFVYVGWVRNDTTGTGTVTFELNQSNIVLSNGVNNQRTPGDLLIEFDFKANPGSQGGYDVTLSYRTWSGSQWSDAGSLAGFADGSVNEFAAVTDCLNGDAELGVAQFGEFALNLTDLLGGDCRAFVSLFAKSRASNQITSTLKDLIKPAGVNLSTCGQLTILKQDEDGAALGGASFSITPNPFTETGSLSVTDNQAPDDDAAAGTIHLGEVEPGTYTVCETAAPAGYIIDPTCVQATVGVNGSATFGPFTNGLGDISWTKLDDETGLVLCCATFTLEGIGGVATGFGPITVVDNGTNDADPDAGELLVTDLLLGTYRITETVPPTGYDLPSPGFQDVVLAGQTAAAASAFRDAPHPVIRVEKTPDENPNAVEDNDVTSGEAATFTIAVHNDGPGTALDVVLADDLPGIGWSIVGASTTMSGCVIANPGADEALSCGPDDIAAGQSLAVVVSKTTVHPTDCGQMVNVAVASAANADEASDGGEITVKCADIEVDKTPDGGVVNAGEEAAFTIVVTNAGSGEARGVIVTDELPAVANGWSIDAAATTLVGCSIAGDPGEVQTLTCGPTTLGGTGAPSNSDSVRVVTTTTPADCGELPNLAEAVTENDGSDSDTGDIAVLCPDLTIEKSPDGEVINAGDAIAFTITITNTGAGTAADVTLDDELPAGFAWAETPDLAQCSITAGDLHCDVGDLAADGVFSVTVTAPTAFADCAENAYVNTAVADASNHAQVDDTGDVLIECPDLEVTKAPDGEVINAGDEISFEIVVTNHGPGTAYDVTLDDELPSGFTWAEDPDLAACAITDGALHCDIGDLGDEDSFTVTVSAPTAFGNCADNAHFNTAVAGAANHADVDDTGDVLIECPDLEVIKTPDGSQIDAGDELSFSIYVINHGPGTAYDVTLDDELPSGFAWAEDPDLAACAITDGALHCDIGDLGDDESFAVTVSAPTSADECAENAYVNTAVVGATNHAQVDDTGDVRIDCPDLTVDKEQVDADVEPTDEPVDAGETAYFAFTVANLGPGAAYDVVVTDTAPAGTVWTIVDDGGLDCESANDGDQQAITCSTDQLGDGESATVLLSYETSVDDCGMLDNSVSVEGSNEPAASTENNADEASIIVECPGLNIVKTADADPIDAGETASFTITFWNAGPGDAFDVLFEDDLPAGLAWHWEIVSDHDPESCSSSATESGTIAISCTFDVLAPSSMEDGVVIAVWADTDRTDCGVLVNSAFVDASNNPGPRLSAQDSITVGCPTIGLQKENDAVSSVLPGETVTYTLTLTVDDPIRDDGVARDVVVSDLLPIGLESPTAISDGGTYDAGNHEITWELGDLPEGEYTLTYQATVADDVANGEELVNAAAAISPNSQCPDFETLGPECEDGSTVVVRVPTLVIDKAANTEVITISGPANAQVATPSVVTWRLTYTLTDGPVTNAVITDAIPAGLDYVAGSASHGGTFADGMLTWSFPMLIESGSVTFQTAIDVETISRSAPTVNVAVISSDQTPEDEGRDEVRVAVEPPVLGGTPTPRPSVPDTATGVGPGGRPVTVPIELVAVLFIGSLGTLAFANVRAVRRRRH
jgi:uncharacterized repeat protein (TIGR01451 family)/fimbrial isopeptide formation D2 family protein